MASPAPRLPRHIAKLRLQYLPFRAMAETARFILAYGNVPYEDEVVWGRHFSERRAEGAYPFDKVPVMTVEYARDGQTGAAPPPLIIAQSGSLARFAARLAGVFETERCREDPAWQAYNDSVFEVAQEMCTVNPTLNCYTGQQHRQMKRMYLNQQFVPNVLYLERQLREVVVPHLCRRRTTPARADDDGDVFFGGLHAPSYADFNVFHHIDNAETLYGSGILREIEDEIAAARGEEGSTAHLRRWMGRMRDGERRGEGFARFKQYLDARPAVIGAGTSPGLRDAKGVVVRQSEGTGRTWIKDGLFSDTP